MSVSHEDLKEARAAALLCGAQALEGPVTITSSWAVYESCLREGRSDRSALTKHEAKVREMFVQAKQYETRARSALTSGVIDALEIAKAKCGTASLLCWVGEAPASTYHQAALEAVAQFTRAALTAKNSAHDGQPIRAPKWVYVDLLGKRVARRTSLTHEERQDYYRALFEVIDSSRSRGNVGIPAGPEAVQVRSRDLRGLVDAQLLIKGIHEEYAQTLASLNISAQAEAGRTAGTVAMRTSSRKETTQSTKPAVTTLEDVRDRLECLCNQGEPFTSQRALERTLGYSLDLINRAIESSEDLRAWSESAQQRQHTPIAEKPSDVVVDNAQQSLEATPADILSDGEVGKATSHLLQGAEPEERSRLSSNREILSSVTEAGSARPKVPVADQQTPLTSVQHEILRALRRFQLRPGVPIGPASVVLVTLDTVPEYLIRAELSLNVGSGTNFSDEMHNLVACGLVAQEQRLPTTEMRPLPPPYADLDKCDTGIILKASAMPAPPFSYDNALGERVEVTRQGKALIVRRNGTE